MFLMRVFRAFLILCTALASGCALLETELPKKPAPTGLIATPASYYSTAKAKYLGTKYKDNLDRLVERIVRNPKTTNLQFANNISSVGGIGFFTHSAAKIPDERYLEVVLATPETFEVKGDYSDKAARLFSLYGTELLGILQGDADIFQEKELSGYGLNLAWRNVAVEGTGKRVLVERAIIYFSKERVRRFLRRELSQNEFLGDAVIFAIEEDGPLQLVSYSPQEVRPDFRPAIREDNLAAAEIPAKAVPAPASKEPVQRTEEKIDKARIDSSRIKESAPTSVTKPGAVEGQTKAEVPVVAEPRSVVVARKPATSPTAKANPVAPLVTEQLAAKEDTDIVGKTEQAPIENAQEVRREATHSSVPAPDVVVEKPASVEAKARQPIASAVVVAPRTTALVEKAAEPVPAAKISGAVKSAPVPSKVKVDPAIVTPKLESPPPAPKIAVELPKKQSVEVRPLEDDKVSPAQPVIEASTAKPAEVEAPKSLPPPATVKAESKPTVPQSAVEVAARVSRVAPEVQPSVAIVPKTSTKIPEPVTPARPPTNAKKAEPIVAPPKPAAAPKIVLEPKEVQPAVDAKSRQTVAMPPALPADSTTKSKFAGVKPPVSAPTVPAKAEPNPSAVKPSVEIAAPVSELTMPKAKAPVASLPPPAVKIPEDARLLEPANSRPLSSPTKVEQAAGRTKPTALAVAPTPRENTSEKPAGEQIALLKNKPIEAPRENKPLVRPVPRALEGFIVQIAFNDKEKARRWAEGMEQRGYAVSITEAGAEGALRVRLGNFVQRDDAERQLRNFKDEGLSGIIINLPQAFRPEARSSIP